MTRFYLARATDSAVEFLKLGSDLETVLVVDSRYKADQFDSEADAAGSPLFFHAFMQGDVEVCALVDRQSVPMNPAMQDSKPLPVHLNIAHSDNYRHPICGQRSFDNKSVARTRYTKTKAQVTCLKCIKCIQAGEKPPASKPPGAGLLTRHLTPA